MLTEKQIREIKERREKAPEDIIYHEENGAGAWERIIDPHAADFYALARINIPALLADGEEMQELIQNMRRQLEGASLRSVRRSQNHLGMVGGKGN